MTAIDVTYADNGSLKYHLVPLTLGLIVVQLMGASNQSILILPNFLRQSLLEIAKDPNRSVWLINLIPFCLTIKTSHRFITAVYQQIEITSQLQELSLLGVLTSQETMQKAHLEASLDNLR